MSVTSITALLAELERELPPDLAGRARILAEVEDHLVQSAERLTRGGLARPAAEAEAVARFGDPADLAAVFGSIAAAGGEPDQTGVPLTGWQRAASLVALAAGAVSALGLSTLGIWALIDPDLAEGRLPRALSLLAVAMLAAVVAGMLIMRQRLDLGGRLRVSAFGPLALIPLGIAAMLVTLELGQSTGDYEWYGAGIGLALVAQGLLAAWLLQPGRRATS
jgi:hypothetical protein